MFSQDKPKNTSSKKPNENGNKNNEEAADKQAAKKAPVANLTAASPAAWDSMFDKKKEEPKMDPSKVIPFAGKPVPVPQHQYEDDAIVSMESEATKPKFTNKGKKQSNN